MRSTWGEMGIWRGCSKWSFIYSRVWFENCKVSVLSSFQDFFIRFYTLATLECFICTKLAKTFGFVHFINFLIWLLPKPKFFSHLGGILGTLKKLWWIYGIGLLCWSPLDFQIFDAVHIQVKNSVSEGVLNCLNLHLTSSLPWLDVHWLGQRFFFF